MGGWETGRGVSGEEAVRIGLVQRLAEPGEALSRALDPAQSIAQFPQGALRADRGSALEQWQPAELDAVANQVRMAMEVYENDPEAMGRGAERSESGEGRHGVAAGGSLLSVKAL